MTQSPLSGLTSAQVAQAAKNIPIHHVSTARLVFTTIANQIVSFFFFLLVLSGVLSLLLHHTVDAVIFFAIAGVNAVIGFFQEFHASKSTQALEKLITHKVTVRRDGAECLVDSTEVVQGDIVIAEAGDVIVADMVVREQSDLLIDESVRTGETMPRSFQVGETIFAGVHIVQGTLIGQVVSVGKQSSLLMYADKISHTEKNNNFEHFIRTVSIYILVATIVCLAFVLVVNVLITQSITLPEYVLYAIAMLVGVVPESLPLIITIILTREALSLAKSSVIVKKLSVLQNLGSMNYFFTDKTGTITENKLQVKEVFDVHNLHQQLARIAHGQYKRTPMDTVFDAAIAAYVPKPANQTLEHETMQLSPFQNERGFSVYTFADGTEVIRGQYASVSAACASTSDHFNTQCLQAEQQGLRIIAFAQKNTIDTKHTLLGAVLFEDPLKDDAVQMYRSLQDVSVDVKIITGDSTSVACYVAHIVDSRITEKDIFSMDQWTDNASNQRIADFRVYARCKPEQKLSLINEHLQRGVIGFLGEGINDALALKRSDIGFVVNNATDVARQSADVVLMEKSLAPIMESVRMSRKAFAHIRTYLLCTLAGNIGTLISLTAVVIFWQQIPMLPIQLLLNNILTDVPLLFLISDRVSDSVISKPVNTQAKNFFRYIVIFALVSSVFDGVFFFLFKGYDISVLRTGWFVFSVLAELTLVFSLRSELPLLRSPKIATALGVVLMLCYGFTLALPYLPFARVFHLYPLSLMQVSIIIAVIVLYACTNEAIKKVLSSITKNNQLHV